MQILEKRTPFSIKRGRAFGAFWQNTYWQQLYIHCEVGSLFKLHCIVAGTRHLAASGTLQGAFVWPDSIMVRPPATHVPGPTCCRHTANSETGSLGRLETGDKLWRAPPRSLLSRYTCLAVRWFCGRLVVDHLMPLDLLFRVGVSLKIFEGFLSPVFPRLQPYCDTNNQKRVENYSVPPTSGLRWIYFFSWSHHRHRSWKRWPLSSQRKEPCRKIGNLWPLLGSFLVESQMNAFVRKVYVYYILFTVLYSGPVSSIVWFKLRRLCEPRQFRLGSNCAVPAFVAGLDRSCIRCHFRVLPARLPTRTNTTISARSSQKAQCKVRIPTNAEMMGGFLRKKDCKTSGLCPMTPMT